MIKWALNWYKLSSKFKIFNLNFMYIKSKLILLYLYLVLYKIEIYVVSFMWMCSKHIFTNNVVCNFIWKYVSHEDYFLKKIYRKVSSVNFHFIILKAELLVRFGKSYMKSWMYTHLN